MSTKFNLVRYGGNYQTLHAPYLPPSPVPTGPWASISNVVGTTWQRTTDPDSFPDWRRRISLGVASTSNLYGRKQRCRVIHGDVTLITQSVSSSTRAVSSVNGPCAPIDLSLISFTDTLLYDRCKMDFLKKVQEAQTLFQSGVFIGELKETVSLITRPGRLIRKAVDGYVSRVKKIRARKAKDFRHTRTPRQYLREISDEWLEFQFGVKPLVNDVADAARALADLSLRRDSRVVQARLTSDSTGVDVNWSSGSIGHLQWAYDRTSRYTSSVQFKGAVWCNTTNVSAFADKFGFVPQAWIPTAWELVPWSFLIDYFVNIGDLLSAVSYGTSNVTWSQSTSRVSRETTIEARRFIRNATFWSTISLVVTSAPKSVSLVTEVNRVASPSLCPVLIFSVPGMESTRWLNIAALVAGRRSDTTRL